MPALHRRRAVVAFALGAVLAALCPPATAAAAAGCDAVPLTLAPVCGADGITYTNAAVARCQGVSIAGAGGCAQRAAGGGAAALAGAGADWLTPSAAAGGLAAGGAASRAVLLRYSAEGFKFAGKLRQPGRTAPLLRQHVGTRPPGAGAGAVAASALAAPGAVYAARITGAGELYLRREQWHLGNASGALHPRAAASAGGTHGGQRAGPPASLARAPQQVQGADGRREVDSHRTPYSAVGFLRAGVRIGRAGRYDGCTATQIGPRTVLTAGHCVYDSKARAFRPYVYFFPNRHGGGAHCHGTRCYRDGYTAARAGAITTWFNNAGPWWSCNGGQCQTQQDRVYDIAVVTVEADLTNFGWLAIGYNCTTRGYSVRTAGYPDGLSAKGTRMFTQAGSLRRFDGCGAAWSANSSLASSTLDFAMGQSGSALWDGGGMVRAVHVASGPVHRAVTRELFDALLPMIK